MKLLSVKTQCVTSDFNKFRQRNSRVTFKRKKNKVEKQTSCDHFFLKWYHGLRFHFPNGKQNREVNPLEIKVKLITGRL